MDARGFVSLMNPCVVVQDVDDLNTGRANGYVSGQIYFDVVMVGCPLCLLCMSCLHVPTALVKKLEWAPAWFSCSPGLEEALSGLCERNLFWEFPRNMGWTLTWLLTWLQARYGDPRIAVAIMSLPALAMFFCGASCVTSNSRCISLPVCTLNLA